jgi:hypothetical protein
MKRVAYVAGLSMVCVILLSILYTIGAIGFVYYLRRALLKKEDMSPSDRNGIGCIVCVISCAVSTAVCFSVIAWKLLSPHQRHQPMSLVRMLISTWTFPLLSIVTITAVVKSTRMYFSGLFVGGIVIVMSTLSVLHLNMESAHLYRLDPVVRAPRTALAIERAATDVGSTALRAATRILASRPGQKISSWRTFVGVLKKNLPALLVPFIAFVFAFGIFRVFHVAKSKPGGVQAVFLLALLVKVGGNKIQIQMFKNNQKIALWSSQTAVFFYEYMTALLIRVMLHSVPNESVAIYLSLFNAAVELMTRTWFFVGYISMGGKHLVGLAPGESKFHRKYVRRGQLRVIDGCTNSMVEYITMFVAAAVIAILSDTNAFELLVKDQEEVVIERLLRVLGVQVLTELVVDGFVFALEAKGGMAPLQLQHWKNMSLINVCMQFFSVIAITSAVVGFLL